ERSAVGEDSGREGADLDGGRSGATEVGHGDDGRPERSLVRNLQVDLVGRDVPERRGDAVYGYGNAFERRGKRWGCGEVGNERKALAEESGEHAGREHRLKGRSVLRGGDRHVAGGADGESHGHVHELGRGVLRLEDERGAVDAGIQVRGRSGEGDLSWSSAGLRSDGEPRRFLIGLDRGESPLLAGRNRDRESR